MVHLAQPGDKYVCARCHSSHVDLMRERKRQALACLDCGYETEISPPKQ
ncbi:TPA: hypothetical protein HA241_04295 [Candidatus Woesearchaeota archaeon]|nr:hypothetical protein [Candidatus Woesearchaeota archaeon]